MPPEGEAVVAETLPGERKDGCRVVKAGRSTEVISGALVGQEAHFVRFGAQMAWNSGCDAT